MILLLVLTCHFNALLHIPTCKETNHEHHSFLKEYSVFHHTILTIIFQDFFFLLYFKWYFSVSNYLTFCWGFISEGLSFCISCHTEINVGQRATLCAVFSADAWTHACTHIEQSKPISQGGVRGQMSADFKKSDELAFCFEQKQQNLSNWCCWVKADVSRSVNGINKDFSLFFFWKET